jgi:hypothetical protein
MFPITNESLSSSYNVPCYLIQDSQTRNLQLWLPLSLQALSRHSKNAFHSNRLHQIETNSVCCRNKNLFADELKSISTPTGKTIIKPSTNKSNDSSYHWVHALELCTAVTLQWSMCNCLNRFYLLWPRGELNSLRFPSSRFLRCWVNTFEWN